MFDVDIDLKLDGFFAQWILDVSTAKILAEVANTADQLEAGVDYEFNFDTFNATVQTQAHPQPRLPISSSISTVRVPTLNPTAGKTQDKPVISHGLEIPRFFEIPEIGDEVDVVKKKLGSGQMQPLLLGEILKTHSNLPDCFAPAIMKKYGSTVEEFLPFYEKYIAGKPADERFFNFLVGRENRNVVPSDLTPYVQSIVETHESLNFLVNEPLFQEKFVDFIVTRCFYCMDPELRGTASLLHFKKYGIASIFMNAHTMPDINETHHIFNYQHFYVAFCKFWDLDSDNDGYLSLDDLTKLNDSTISPVICERFYNSTMYPRQPHKPVDFAAFSYFLMASEDKTNPTSINFWFRLCDVDEDGVISMAEIEKLYETQFEMIKMTGNETIPFDDIQKQLIDMVSPANPAVVTVRDLIASKQADLFFNTLMDIQKFLTREYQFPASNPSFDEATKGLTPWEIYVLIEYEQLVNDPG